MSQYVTEKGVPIPDLEQYNRWERVIQEMEATVPLWFYHADRLHLTPAPSCINTAAVDGVNLYYDTAFTKTLTDGELRFVALHEVFHVVQDHISRGSKLLDTDNAKENLFLWNIACDYAIHQILIPLVQQGFYPGLEVPSSALYDVKYKDMSAEAIYLDLKSRPPTDTSLDCHFNFGSGPMPSGAIPIDGGWVIILDSKGNVAELSPEEKEAIGQFNLNSIKEQIEKDIKQAKQSHLWGNETEDYLRTAADSDPRQAATDYRNILANWIIEQCNSDYSYQRLNKSYLNQGMIVPSLYSKTLKGKVGIDVSGSISEELLNYEINQLEALRAQIPDHELEVIFIDCEIKDIQKLEGGTPIKNKINGGGGTSFVPFFEHVKKDPDGCNFCIFFTDGWGDCPAEPPNCPVLWVMVTPDHQKQPWGEHLEIPLNVH